jgi:hypothetical protein
MLDRQTGKKTASLMWNACKPKRNLPSLLFSHKTHTQTQGKRMDDPERIERKRKYEL